ncbi:MAG: FKBP-type peptidyl-prolyl cis-trans isomerase [Candidatus Sumerlaeaceae bacterium]|jgi:FK506-binding nuclear protein
MATTRVSSFVRAGIVAAIFVLAGRLLAQETTQSATVAKATQTSYTLETGVIFQDLRVGTGPEPRRGQMVGIHYEGRVLSTGKMIDNSRIKIIPNPLRITLGAGKLIPGLEDGLIGMRLGGRRLIEIPPDRAYGDAGIPPEIPPKARLLFDVELVEVRDAETTSSAAQE